jgi:hypothetical protein
MPSPAVNYFCVAADGLTIGSPYSNTDFNVTVSLLVNQIGLNFENVSVDGKPHLFYSTADVYTFNSNQGNGNVSVSLQPIGWGSKFGGGGDYSDMQICYQLLLPAVPPQNGIVVTSAPPPKPHPPNSPPNFSAASPYSVGENLPTAGSLLFVGLGTLRLRRRLVRGRKKHMEMDPGLLRAIEEWGAIDIAALIAVVLLFALNYIVLSAIVAFAFGIMFAYLIDRIRSSRLADADMFAEYAFERKQGIVRYWTELGVGEILLLAATLWLFAGGYFLESVVFAFALGVVISYYVDRIRNVGEAKLAVAAQAGAMAAPALFSEKKAAVEVAPEADSTEPGPATQSQPEAQPDARKTQMQAQASQAYTPPPEIGTPPTPPTQGPKNSGRNGKAGKGRKAQKRARK